MCDCNAIRRPHKTICGIDYWYPKDWSIIKCHQNPIDRYWTQCCNEIPPCDEELLFSLFPDFLLKWRWRKEKRDTTDQSYSIYNQTMARGAHSGHAKEITAERTQKLEANELENDNRLLKKMHSWSAIVQTFNNIWPLINEFRCKIFANFC